MSTWLLYVESFAELKLVTVQTCIGYIVCLAWLSNSRESDVMLGVTFLKSTACIELTLCHIQKTAWLGYSVVAWGVHMRYCKWLIPDSKNAITVQERKAGLVPKKIVYVFTWNFTCMLSIMTPGTWSVSLLITVNYQVRKNSNQCLSHPYCMYFKTVHLGTGFVRGTNEKCIMWRILFIVICTISNWNLLQFTTFQQSSAYIHLYQYYL